MRQIVSVGLQRFELVSWNELGFDDRAEDFFGAVAARQFLAGSRRDPTAMGALRLAVGALTGAAAVGGLGDDEIIERCAELIGRRWLAVIRRRAPLLIGTWPTIPYAPEPEEPAPPPPRTWIEIALTGDAGYPVANQRYRLELPDQRVAEGSTDRAGVIRLEELPDGECALCFPALDAQAWAGPAGSREEIAEGAPGFVLVAQQGDCLASLAERTGFFWRQIWDHPENQSLRERRQNPNVIFPGDRIYVPARAEKTVFVRTGLVHPCRRIGVPSRLRVRLLDHGRPLADLPYRLRLDTGEELAGRTTAAGAVEAAVPPQSRQAELAVETERGSEIYRVNLGHLDPIEERSGVQQRLRALGFDCGDSGRADEATASALRAFQARSGLVVTGEADDPTRQKLREAYLG